ncbi:hypothetical protein QBC44DRAFT_140205 [Cladorrhinum sp. PSN332]|nr:hypothetical protein QBC44DRAFT_140205 [Cladorrhinum sp. PSN332]
MAPPPNANLSSEQLGAILGSVLGFAGLVLILCCCLAIQRKRRLRTTRVVYADAYYSQSQSDFSGSVTDVRYYTRRGGGGGGGGMSQQRGWVGRGVGASFAPRRTDSGFTTVPPPALFPPTPRHTPYVQTPYAQISGVQRYP